MRRIILYFYLFFLAVCGTINGQHVVRIDRDLSLPEFVGYVQDEIIVVLKEHTPPLGLSDYQGRVQSSIREFEELQARHRVNRMKKQFTGELSGQRVNAIRERMSRFYKVRFEQGSLEEVMEAYGNNPWVEHVEPIGIHRVSVEANDTYYRSSPNPDFPFFQWHYWFTTGIGAETAWDIETGSGDVVVGVLDTGVRYFHVDLGGNNAVWGPDDPKSNGNIWNNPGEIANNGEDDDGNGFIDDTIGWDFVSAAGGGGVKCIDQDCSEVDNDPDDGDGHGTHVAGTIGAITNNGFLAAGVAGGFGGGTLDSGGNGVKIIGLRIGYNARQFGADTGIVRMDWAAEAMNYLADLIDRHHINVAAINCSWGSSNTGGLEAAVDNLLAHDVMIIHAAGNNNSTIPDFLGDKSGVMNVAATDINGYGASFSNHGSYVDLAAPGVDILSTYANPSDPDKDNHYVAVLDGTSMAAPHAAGAAALLESFDPNLTGPEKFALMVNNVTAYTDTRNLGSGILNAHDALIAIGPPDPPGHVWARALIECGKIQLSWDAAPRADSYRIYYQEDNPGPPFDPCDIGDPVSGANVGEVTTVTISGLAPGTTYYFAVTAKDVLGESGFSAVANATAEINCFIFLTGFVQTISANGIPGVEVSANNGGGATTTDAGGFYEVAAPLGWADGMITVSKSQWEFEPNEVAVAGPISVNTDVAGIVGFRIADFDVDGDIDLADLAWFSQRWLMIDCVNVNDCGGADMDLSNRVDLVDWALFVRQWGVVR